MCPAGKHDVITRPGIGERFGERWGLIGGDQDVAQRVTPAGGRMHAPTGDGGTTGVRLNARARNEAIWSRLTSSLGQNRSLVGGLQPTVTPASRSRSMSP